MKELCMLFIQLGFHTEYPDSSTAATTYNDGIYYVASFVKREFPSARIDMCQMMWNQHPRDFPIEDYDYIFISALATQFWSNIETLQSMRDRMKEGATAVMGGPHAAFAPYEALKFVDYVILGEGEVPAVQLIEAIEQKSDLDEVDNLCYIGDTGKLVMNKFARYGNFEIQIDPELLKGAPKLHWATVSMSRGCPFNCSFCYAIRLLGRKFRTKNVQHIRAELDGIYRETGCKRFYVTDLNFPTRKDFCYEVADAVHDAGYKFIAMSRIDLADNVDLLLRLKEAGFEEYCLGVESEDPSALDIFNKKVDPSLQTKRLHTFAEHDIYIHSAIIYGLDEQDAAAIRRTARWCAEARIVHPTFVCLAEYPFQNLLFGSRQDVEDHRIIMGVPTYQHYSFVGMFPRHMRPSELQQLIAESYEIFFKRAFEIEKRPQRRVRLKMYSRSIDQSLPGMRKHIAFLKEFERPYYTKDGILKEQMLVDEFEEKYGDMRKWLSQVEKRDLAFDKNYSR